MAFSKAQRLLEGADPRVLELCSGAGGLALGFRSSGFELRAHVENSSSASLTYAHNLLGPRVEDDDPRLVPTDMVADSESDILEKFGIEESFADAFDVVIAGLPCQAFARVGRSKLRSLAGGTEHVYTTDPRGHLYQRFIELIEAAQPAIVILENVPDILNFGGLNVPEEIAQSLQLLGYRSAYTLMNAAHFGVPQYRERLFLVAYHEALGTEPTFPSPTHQVAMRRGHRDLRTAASRYGEGRAHFHQPSSPNVDALPSVTAREALDDLPAISFHLASPVSRPSMAESRPYRTSPQSDYAVAMRGDLVESSGHLVRVTPRDFPIFALMESGAEYPAALQIAETRFNDIALAEGTTTTAELEKLRTEVVPPYDASKFANKWWKLDPDEPSRTLTAHLGRDTYSHIHFDSTQRRMISVREAARLQSFPDSFEFPVSMNDAFRQIGNAVPPRLANAVAENIRADIRAAGSVQNQDVA